MRILLTTLLVLLTLSARAEPPEAFTLESLEGGSYTLPGEQDGVGIYFFWASWCPYCKALMPHLQSVVDEYGGEVTVYALNFRDKKDPRDTLAGRGYEFTILPDADDVAEDWGVHGTPGVFVLDEEGAVRLNLYDVVVENPTGWDALDHSQKAARRAPFWAARIRQAVDDAMGNGN